MENPYSTPTGEGRKEPAQPQRRQLNRGEVASRLAIAGLLGGALLGTVGYLLLIALAEFLLTPPLKSPPNYGQFGIIVLGVGFYLSMFGLCLSVVPYGTWLGYVPVHAAGLWLIWGTSGQFFAEVDWTEAPVAVMIALLLLPTPVAMLFDVYGSRLRLRSAPS